MPQIQVVLSQDSQFFHELTEERTTVGRVDDNDLCIQDISVSSHHAEIVHDGVAYHLHDLGSTNGSYVNGEQVTDAVLRHGDEVRFGAIPCVFHSTEDILSESQPLPKSSAPYMAVASVSARPIDFISTSPIPRNVKAKDPIATAALALGVLALVACAGAATMALIMQA